MKVVAAGSKPRKTVENSMTSRLFLESSLDMIASAFFRWTVMSRPLYPDVHMHAPCTAARNMAFKPGPEQGRHHGMMCGQTSWPGSNPVGLAARALAWRNNLVSDFKLGA
jgi:hypothetical protein